ncbi:hypothetical protein BKA70DRAFT_548644 [Coprinopsis sp. MPI-PUGE-AT-0042]|nr:hypothetical protein BKA70DRAFT_548644 [Coprinopsis sp. MPI-PUGE-AT-0042]
MSLAILFMTCIPPLELLSQYFGLGNDHPKKHIFPHWLRFDFIAHKSPHTLQIFTRLLEMRSSLFILFCCSYARSPVIVAFSFGNYAARPCHSNVRRRLFYRSSDSQIFLPNPGSSIIYPFTSSLPSCGWAHRSRVKRALSKYAISITALF